MGASSVEGVGVGSAEGLGLGGPGNGRNTYVSKNQPPGVNGRADICAAGIVTVASWKTTITFDTPFKNLPDKYSVLAIQSDFTNSDGHGAHPPHIEKLDSNGNNENGIWDSGFNGFVLHSGDGDSREFMWIISTIGVNSDS